MHENNYIHNDIKEDNICVGHENANVIFLIDYNISPKFRDATGKHVVKENLHKFTGNFMFASLNSCRGNTKSRRDDIESMFYLLIYLLNKNYLPWQDISTRSSILQKLNERMKAEHTNRLFKLIPKRLNKCLKGVLLLQFEEEPAYDYYIEVLQECFRDSL